MKIKVQKLSCMILSAILCLSLFVSCRKERNPDSESVESHQTPEVTGQVPKKLELIADGKATFTVIRPDRMGKVLEQSLQNLYSAFLDVADIKISIRSDWKRENEEQDPETLEILVGNTNYPETREALNRIKYYDYIIEVVGNKLVIAGNLEEKTALAVNYFIQNILKEKAGKNLPVRSLTFNEEDGYHHRFAYKLSEFTVMGHPIEDYRLVVSGQAGLPELRCAALISHHVERYYGKILTTVTDLEPAEQKELVIGVTNRSDRPIPNREFGIRTEGETVFLEADSFYGYEELVRRFTTGIADPTKATAGISAQTAFQCHLSDILKDGAQHILDESEGFSVLFHNIYGYNFEGTAPIAQRMEHAVLLYEAYDPDVLALQEMSDYARSEGFPTRLESAGYTEVPTSAAGQSNFTPIYYRKDRLNLLESGFHVYDTACRAKDKSFTYAVFERKTDGKKFAVCSTHFWHLPESESAGSDAARSNSAIQLIQQIRKLEASYDCPVLFGGDLNCNRTSQAYGELANQFPDVQKIAGETESQSTHHGYPVFNRSLNLYPSGDFPKGGAEQAIDHVFYGGTGAELTLFDTITDLYALLSSDHCPLLVRGIWK